MTGLFVAVVLGASMRGVVLLRRDLAHRRWVRQKLDELRLQ